MYKLLTQIKNNESPIVYVVFRNGPIKEAETLGKTHIFKNKIDRLKHR